MVGNNTPLHPDRFGIDHDIPPPAESALVRGRSLSDRTTSLCVFRPPAILSVYPLRLTFCFPLITIGVKHRLHARSYKFTHKFAQAQNGTQAPRYAAWHPPLARHICQLVADRHATTARPHLRVCTMSGWARKRPGQPRWCSLSPCDDALVEH